MNISFCLIKIEILQFAVFSENIVDGASNVASEFQFGISSDMAIMQCIGTFVFTNLEGDNILKLQVACNFAVSPADIETLKQKDGTYKIPVGFLQHLAMILVGTSRGILFAKTESNKVNKLYLPLINLTEVIKDDFIVKLNTDILESKVDSADQQ